MTIGEKDINYLLSDASCWHRSTRFPSLGLHPQA